MFGILLWIGVKPPSYCFVETEYIVMKKDNMEVLKVIEDHFAFGFPQFPKHNVISTQKILAELQT